MGIAFLVYFISKAAQIQECTIGIGAITGVVSILMIMGFFEGVSSKAEKYMSKLLKFTIPVSILFLLIGGLMPDGKTIALMYVAPKLAESDIIKRDVPEVYQMALEKLKEQLAPKSKEEKK